MRASESRINRHAARPSWIEALGRIGIETQMGGAHEEDLTPRAVRLRTQLLVAALLCGGAGAALWYGRPKEVDAAVPSPAAITTTTPGRFVVPPTKAEEMYEPETFGRSASDVVVIE